MGVENNLSPSMRSSSLPFKIGSSIDSYSDMVDSDSVDSDLVDLNLGSSIDSYSDMVDSNLVDSDSVDSDLVDLNLGSSKSCGYPSQLYNVLIFLTSNLDNSPSNLSLKVANVQKEF